MYKAIDDFIEQYERGGLSRRQLVAGLAVLATPRASVSARTGVRASSLNHVNVRVTDLDRSVAFYRKAFALPTPRAVDGAASVLDLPGGGFISLCPLSVATCGVKPGAKAGDIDHFDLGIDNFNAARVIRQLKAVGVQAEGEGTSVFLSDPDGVMIQLSAPNERFLPMK